MRPGKAKGGIAQPKGRLKLFSDGLCFIPSRAQSAALPPTQTPYGGKAAGLLI
ncbi:hypothetical protein [Neisseria musculi]|uniref:hypothetical protein n=1 Tax=Neisseria musculi TaxID=1815583 RepID=UPI00164B1102|nr:hypothetical protein [Neisseria musculi]